MPDRPDDPPLTLFFLHGLGCSARTWNAVIHDLRGHADEVDTVALDLPGHGDEAASSALTVEQMVDAVISELLERRPQRWALVGHSMGGKIAMIVTARAEHGLPGLPSPIALVLVASSPPGVEPMDEGTRAEMIGWCARRGGVSAADARTFVEANVADALPPDRMDVAVQDVQRVDRTAWLAWLERGSLEDWSDTVGTVHTPTLVVAGSDDDDLGVDAQRSLVLPHTPTTDVAVIPNAAHLIMLEQPDALADLIAAHVSGVQTPLGELPLPFAQLLLSDRVSARTRGELLARLDPPAADAGMFSDAQRAVLAALVRRVLPQRGTAVDLAARLEATLAAGARDGWRFAELPDDVQAWRRGLDTLAAVAGGFVDLSPEEQDDRITRMVDGRGGSDEDAQLSDEQMTLWFEDVRAETVRAWLAHPQAMARIGYDGFANGGDGRRKQGYLRVSPGEKESWQPPLPPTRRNLTTSQNSTTRKSTA